MNAKKKKLAKVLTWISIISAILAVPVLIVIIGIYFQLPDKEPLTAEKFREVCEDNGFTVTDFASGNLHAKKENYYISYSVYSDAAEAEQYFGWEWERNKGWSGAPWRIIWDDREFYNCAKWGKYQIFARNGSMVLYGYYDLDAQKWLGYDELNRIFHKLGC